MYWLPTPFDSFPFTSPTLRHRVSSHFNWSLLYRFIANVIRMNLKETLRLGERERERETIAVLRSLAFIVP